MGARSFPPWPDHAQEGFPCDCKNKSPLDNEVRLFPHGVLNNLLHNNSLEESNTVILFPIAAARPPRPSGEERVAHSRQLPLAAAPGNEPPHRKARCLRLQRNIITLWFSVY